MPWMGVGEQPIQLTSRRHFKNLFGQEWTCSLFYHSIPDLQKGRNIRKLPSQGGSVKGALPASDVGPILRRFLTRAEDVFGDLLSLTLYDNSSRSLVHK
jgi:hypothetical protein